MIRWNEEDAVLPSGSSQSSWGAGLPNRNRMQKLWSHRGVPNACWEVGESITEEVTFEWGLED